MGLLGDQKEVHQKASDSNTHGGFSVLRKHANEYLPPLDMTQTTPTQELVAKDLHGTEWRFKHIFRGERIKNCEWVFVVMHTATQLHAFINNFKSEYAPWSACYCISCYYNTDSLFCFLQAKVTKEYDGVI